MKYISLDKIGIPILTGSNGVIINTEPGNNYPANDLGIPKSNFVKEKNDNIILVGKFEENEVTYPKLDPLKQDFTVIENAKFRFIITDTSTTKKYISKELYDDLVTAYDELNPWFNITSVPNVNLDISYLSEYNLVNKFKVTEKYCETEITTTLDTDIEVCEYIDWLVSRVDSNTTDINSVIEIKPIDELGTWNYVADGNLGLDFKKTYDSMIQTKDPDPEAVGDSILKQNYDIKLPTGINVDSKLQPIPYEEIIPTLASLIISERAPNDIRVTSFFGNNSVGRIYAGLATVAVGTLAVILTGGAALGVAGALAIGASAAGAASPFIKKGVELIQRAFGKFKGSWLEYILERSTNRPVFGNVNNVLQKEIDNDLFEWSGLLLNVRSKMGTTRYGSNELESALRVVFNQLKGELRASDISYPIKVGNQRRRIQIQTVSDSRVNLKLI